MANYIKGLSLAGISILLMTLAAAALSAGPAESDVKLFVEKCGKCHKWQKPIKDFPDKSAAEREKVILKMQGKKPGWISGGDAAIITKLLTENDLAAVEEEAKKLESETAAVPSGNMAAVPHDGEGVRSGLNGSGEEENPAAERLIFIIKYIHGAWNCAWFLLLGLYMAMSGLTRYSEEKKGAEGPRKFDWKKHVSRGKIYIVFVLLGLCGGLAIFALDGFQAGRALPHLLAGCAVAALYAAGGLIGLKLAKGQAANLKTTHLILNLAATALFLFNIISGVVLLLGD